MHASSMENMAKCFALFADEFQRKSKERLLVLDIGGANVNGSYKTFFNEPRFQYIAADIQPDNGVDIVLETSNVLPFSDDSVDIIVCGQTLEHCEFFWQSFKEMVRIIKPAGYIFIIIPSGGPVHKYPVDCYRFNPDSLSALANYTECFLVHYWLDERGPWKDLVGVFSKKFESITGSHNLCEIKNYPMATITPGNSQYLPLSTEPIELTSTKGTVDYLEMLNLIHSTFKPNFYFEIGVRDGRSLQLAKCDYAAVDPVLKIVNNNDAFRQLFDVSSDVFFDKKAAQTLLTTIDFAFIDGMHLFEYALRDFINVERHSSPWSIVAFDDIFPNHPIQAQRVRQSRYWTGDVWKIMECLAEFRPDLILIPINTKPSGMLLVAGLNSKNTTLIDNYNSIVRRFTNDNVKTIPDRILNRTGALEHDDPSITKLIEILFKSKYLCADYFAVNTELQLNRFVRSEHISILSKNKPKISVVVIAYNMAREIPRTLLSLSTKMQYGVNVEEYEIILVDNGSTVMFDKEHCYSICSNLRIISAPDPQPSPAMAINLGISLAEGNIIGVMIDGARLASPGMISNAIIASSACSRPIITTLGFHLGPDLQKNSIVQGYNQEHEDMLLASVNWEKNGYNLFNISAFAGNSFGGWFEPIGETNSLFMHRNMWEEIGGYDKLFKSAGGGLVNHDSYIRACELQGCQVVVLLGEGTFHQIHGGVTTNLTGNPFDVFHDEYKRLRNKSLIRPNNKVIYIGNIHPQVYKSISQSINNSLRLNEQI